MPASLSVVARRLSFIRETDGPNRGAWVEFVQRFTGNDPGDSWCSSFASLVCDVAYRGKSPIKASAASHVRMSDGIAKGYQVTDPMVDDLFYYVDANGHAHHEGIVMGVNPLTGIAGNTSPDGLSSNGTGVFEHAISAVRTVFVRLPQ